MIDSDSRVAQQDTVRSAVAELAQFEDGSAEVRYRARTAGGRQFIVPELVAEMLRLLDGEKTVEEVAELLSRQIGAAVSPENVRQIIDEKLAPNGLVQAGDATETSRDRQTRALELRGNWRKLEFSLRIPLLSQQRLTVVTDRLAMLFRRLPAVLCVTLILLAHVAFYMQPRSIRHMSVDPVKLCIAYLIVFVSMFLHELGHAAAARRFGGEHGDIGFTLYLMFPGLYADMSKAWSLRGWQRAVIDIGGVYFQLLAVIPLWLLHRLTDQPYYATGIYAIDLMTFLALNPVLKFDGYWLLVDLSGLVNLQQRALSLIKEVCVCVVRPGVPPTLQRIAGRARKALLMSYAVTLVCAIVLAVPFLLRRIPFGIRRIQFALSSLPQAAQRSPAELLLDLGALLGSLLFFVFLYRMLGFMTLPFHKAMGAKGPTPSRNAAEAGFMRVTAYSMLLLFLANFALLTCHELGHGFMAVVLGGEFPFFQVLPGAGRSVGIFPYGAAAWKQPFFLLGGHLAELAIAVVLLVVVRRPSQSAWRCLAVLAGISACIDTIVGAGFVPPWPPNTGEVSLAFALLGLPLAAQIALKSAWLALDLLLLFVFFRNLLASAAEWRKEAGYLQRLRLVFAMCGLPWILLAIPYAALNNNWHAGSSRNVGPFFFLLIVLFLLPLFFETGEAERAPRVDLRAGLAWAGTAAIAVLVLQTAIFGYDRQTPRGVYLARHPGEVDVAACNIRIHLQSSQDAHIVVLMRPFVAQHEFLWNRVRNDPPDRWDYYAAFVRASLPVMLVVHKYVLVRSYWDAGVPFFIDGRWSKGARVIEADAELAPTPAGSGLQDITITDFWKSRGLGNIDLTEVDFGPGVGLKQFSTAPPDARPPQIAEPGMLRWLNPTYKGAYKTAQLTVSGLHAQ